MQRAEGSGFSGPDPAIRNDGEGSIFPLEPRIPDRRSPRQHEADRVRPLAMEPAPDTDFRNGCAYGSLGSFGRARVEARRR